MGTLTRVKLIKYTLVIFIVTITVTLITSLKGPKSTHSHEDSPEIWLTSHFKTDSLRESLADERLRSQTQYTSEFISRNKSDYVIYEDVTMVVFACEANYPIKWTFPYPEQLKNVHPINLIFREFRSSAFTSESNAPVNTKFKILLGIRSSKFLSVNITCASVENRTPVQSNIYVYMIGEQMIENEGDTLQVFLDPSRSQLNYKGPPFVIPCRPASPDIKLVLEKQSNIGIWHGNSTVTDETHWTVFQHATFDPKVGFSESNKLGFYPPGYVFNGMYRCSVLISSDEDNTKGEVDSSQSVFVNVTNDPKAQNDMISFEPRSIIRATARIYLENKHFYTRIGCCSGVPNEPPKLDAFPCTSTQHCQFMKNRILNDIANANKTKDGMNINRILGIGRLLRNPSDCTFRYFLQTSVLVVCQGKNVDFMEHYVDMFRAEVGGSITDRSKRMKEREVDKDKHPATDGRFVVLTQYKTLSVANSATLPENIFVTIGRQVSIKLIKQQLRVRNIDTGSTFMVQHGNPGDKITENDVYDELDLLTRYSPKERENLYAHILEYNRDVYYVGEPLIFMCFGVKYFYPGDSYLQLNWENGTNTILESGIRSAKDATDRIFAKIVYLSDMTMIGGVNDRTFSSILATTIPAQKGMTSVNCWMGQSNSSWDTISRQFEIMSSIAPKFLENEEEILNFYLGENGRHEVTCTILHGRPLPRNLKVTKDGKSLQLDVYHKNKILYPRLTQQTDNGSSRDDFTRKVGVKEGKITVTIDFGAIKHDIQGIYECIATNVNGTARRTIKVFVMEKPGIGIPVSLGVAGVLALVLGALALKHWRDKKMVLTLRTST